jgi:hypothetical protein
MYFKNNKNIIPNMPLISPYFALVPHPLEPPLMGAPQSIIKGSLTQS